MHCTTWTESGYVVGRLKSSLHKEIAKLQFRWKQKKDDPFPQRTTGDPEVTVGGLEAEVSQGTAADGGQIALKSHDIGKDLTAGQEPHLCLLKDVQDQQLQEGVPALEQDLCPGLHKRHPNLEWSHCLSHPENILDLEQSHSPVVNIPVQEQNPVQGHQKDVLTLSASPSLGLLESAASHALDQGHEAVVTRKVGDLSLKTGEIQ